LSKKQNQNETENEKEEKYKQLTKTSIDRKLISVIIKAVKALLF